MGVNVDAVLYAEKADGAIVPVSVDTLGNVGAVLNGSSTLLAGQKTVAAAETPEPLAASTPCRSVTVQAKPTNTKSVMLGNASAQFLELPPGASISIGIADLALVYVKVQVAGEGVNYLGVA